jgi:hypothetical protein
LRDRYECGIAGVLASVRFCEHRQRVGNGIPEGPKDYPDPTMFCLLPAHGLYIRASRMGSLRVDGVWLNDVQSSAVYDPSGSTRYG